MKYWLDSEFIEDGKTIDLISFGIVRDDGAEFYAQNLECDFSRASDWVKQNVFPSLTNFDTETFKPVIDADKEGGYGDWYNRTGIASVLSARMAGTGFIHMPDPEVEIWAYFADYDWVVFCQIFGTMMDLPEGFPMYCRDIKQLCDSLGNPKLPEQGKGEHNSLLDARWNKRAYEFLKSREAMLGTQGYQKQFS